MQLKTKCKAYVQTYVCVCKNGKIINKSSTCRHFRQAVRHKRTETPNRETKCSERLNCDRTLDQNTPAARRS